MRKHTEKQPIDDLFARKLSNASLPPSPDGFERLQARLTRHEPETRNRFWRSPATYGYAAAAACLLLGCLFATLYWSSSPKLISNETVALNKRVTESGQKHASTGNALVTARTTDEIASDGPKIGQEPLAATNAETTGKGSSKPTVQMSQSPVGELPSQTDELVLAHKKIENKIEVVTPIASEAPKTLAQNTTQPSPGTERVLVVTIAEPATIGTAHLPVTALDPDKPAMAQIDRTELEAKPTKMSNLWQQVKRVKQGDVFARRDASDDERGLLNRAYSGLKQSFDKDKSVKP